MCFWALKDENLNPHKHSCIVGSALCSKEHPYSNICPSVYGLSLFPLSSYTLDFSIFYKPTLFFIYFIPDSVVVHTAILLRCVLTLTRMLDTSPYVTTTRTLDGRS